MEASLFPVATIKQAPAVCCAEGHLLSPEPQDITSPDFRGCTVSPVTVHSACKYSLSTYITHSANTCCLSTASWEHPRFWEHVSAFLHLPVLTEGVGPQANKSTRQFQKRTHALKRPKPKRPQVGETAAGQVGLNQPGRGRLLWSHSPAPPQPRQT